jgi:hypothetical protein
MSCFVSYLRVGDCTVGTKARKGDRGGQTIKKIFLDNTPNLPIRAAPIKFDSASLMPQDLLDHSCGAFLRSRQLEEHSSYQIAMRGLLVQQHSLREIRQMEGGRERPYWKSFNSEAVRL